MKKERIKNISTFLNKRDFAFFQDLTHKTQEFNHTMAYLGEYPWSKSYQTFEESHDWFDTLNGFDIPEKMLMTDVRYNNIDTDRSFERDSEAIHLDLPNKFIINEMRLSHNYVDGRFFDSKSNLIAFDPSIFYKRFPSSLLIKKTEFLEFLYSRGYSILWCFYGEKYIISQNYNNESKFLQMKGVYTTRNNEIIGKWSRAYR